MSKNMADIIIGIHAVESALKHNSHNLINLWIQKDRKDKRIGAIINLAKKSDIHYEQISLDKLNNKSQGERHQGVVAKLKSTNLKKIDLADLLEKSELLLLVLDGVQDPHNVGACLRTADAAGVDAVIVSKNRSPDINATIRKVASGAVDTVPYLTVSNLARTLKLLADSAVHIIGTSGDSGVSLYNCEITGRVALVMGSEEKGMRRLTVEGCDEVIALPMQGNVESLNISVATGICLYEIRRRLMCK